MDLPPPAVPTDADAATGTQEGSVLGAVCLGMSGRV